MRDAVCLIGGAGFVGGAVREALKAQGREVVIVGRSPTCTTSPGERYIAWAEKPVEALSGRTIGAVIDLSHASVPNPRGEQQLVADLTANLTSLTANLDLARAVSARRYLYVSSGGTVYGDAGAGTIPEDRPAAPISSYGITKLASERLVAMTGRNHGFDVVIARPANIYGPGQLPFRGQGIVATAMGLAIRQTPVTVFGDGSAMRDYIFAGDCATGLLAALAQGEAGQIYNMGSGVGISLSDLLDRIATRLAGDGVTLRRHHVSGNINEVASNILDSTKLRAATGWCPKTSLDEGLGETWRWIRSAVKD